VRRFNASDADKPVELYHEDAVNHQAVQESIAGSVAIREMFRFAATDITCSPEVIHEAGDVAIFAWKGPLGLRGCGFFHREGRSRRLPARSLGRAVVSQEARPAD
jgi:ketosteroid isomerase-like protein